MLNFCSEKTNFPDVPEKNCEAVTCNKEVYKVRRAESIVERVFYNLCLSMNGECHKKIKPNNPDRPSFQLSAFYFLLSTSRP